MARISNTQIVRELKNGTPAGCSRLVDHYQERLIGEAVNVFQVPRHEAEELVSDVLLTVVEKIASFEFKRSEGDFHLWVMTIFRNRVRDVIRSLARRNSYVMPFDEQPLEDDEGGTPEAGLEIAKELVRNYQEAVKREEGDITPAQTLTTAVEVLESMQPWERTLLRCRALDVPYEEIAQYTGKTVQQLKVYHPRVKQRFVKLMVASHPELGERAAAVVKNKGR
jgi:RNA polymerase sigma factor (sigma-70 family)